MSFKLFRITTLVFSILLCSVVALAQVSAEAEAHFKRGEALLQAKQYDDAIEEFKKAIKLNRKWPEAHYMLGMTYDAIPIVEGGSSDNPKAALKAFEEAVKLKPDWPEALTELARKYATFLQDDKAIKTLKKAIALKPELAAAHQHLGFALLRAGNYKEAIDSLNEAIRLKPELGMSHKMLGLAYLAVDDREKAVEQYKLLQSLDPAIASDLDKAIQSPTKPTFGMVKGKLISLPEPEYPEAARNKGISGTVIVQVTINEEGKVTSVQAIRGPVELYAASEAAARKARFAPPMLAGKPVAITGVLTFNFVPRL